MVTPMPKEVTFTNRQARGVVAARTRSARRLPEEERTCQVCSKTMTGKKPYETHMAGKAHQKKVKQMAMGAAA